MNKVLSQAIKKAVSEFKPQVDQKNKTKGPDLFSLNSNTELFQNSRGINFSNLIGTFDLPLGNSIDSPV